MSAVTQACTDAMKKKNEAATVKAAAVKAQKRADGVHTAALGAVATASTALTAAIAYAASTASAAATAATVAETAEGVLWMQPLPLQLHNLN